MCKHGLTEDSRSWHHAGMAHQQHPADRICLARETLRNALGDAVAAENWPRVTAIGELLQRLDDRLARQVCDDGRLEEVIAARMRRAGDPLGYDTSHVLGYARQAASDALAGRHEEAVDEELVRLSHLFQRPGPEDNPQGLATFDAMDDPGYRSVARRVVDKYRCEHGLPPLTWLDDDQ